jgi:hypothetical protein
MANRWLKQFIKVADSNVVDLDGYVNCNGASNAVSASTVAHVTVTKGSTGQYNCVLADPYSSCLGVYVMPVLKTALKDITWAVTSVDVTAPVQKIVIQFMTGASAADLGSGDGFYLIIRLKNSGLPVGE